MIYKVIILLFSLTLCSISVKSQNETRNWYFGDKGGFTFNMGELNVSSDGNMSTPAGCSSISDVDGELLFYTNGNSVWNKNHVLMENGTGLPGDINNTQTSIIIPKPNDPSTYYIFSTRERPSTSAPLLTAGFFYSEVRFTAQNPLGIVTITNSRLTESITERVTAIHHATSNTIRVITLGSFSGDSDEPKDTFFIFNVTEDGIQRPPIRIRKDIDFSSVGAMKISPNGEHIAIADYNNRWVYIYDFDNENVTMTHNITVNPDLGPSPVTPYGLEFSQDSKNLYFASRGVLRKFIIANDAFFNEVYVVGTAGQNNFGSLQLASNGNIYVATYSANDPLTSLGQMGVITNPNSSDGNSGFMPLGVRLLPGQSFKGLPNFIQSFLRNRIITKNECVTTPFDFSLDAYDTITDATWDFGDGTTTNGLNPSHQYANDGEFLVTATITMGNRQIPLYKKVTVYPLPSIDADERIMQCDLDNDGISFFNLNTIDEKINNPDPDNELFFYNTYNDALNDEDQIENPEVYENLTNPQELFVKIVSPEGCTTISNFFIETNFTDLSGISDMYVCEDSDDVPNNGEGIFNLRNKSLEIRSQFNIPQSSSLSFFTSFQDAQTQLSAIEHLYFQFGSATIWVRVDSSESGCNGIGAIKLIVNAELPINIQEEYTICDPSLQSMISLDGNITNERWEWIGENGNIISTNRIFQLTQPGNYSVSVYKTQNGIECLRTEEFTVYGIRTPVFDEVIAGDYQITASIDGDSQYEFSLDGIYYFGEGTSYTFFNVQPGIYTIYARDVNDCEPPIDSEISFIGFPKYFTPNADGFKDVWKIYGISANFYTSATIEIYNRYGKRLHIMDLNTNDYGWNGTFNGEHLRSTDYWFTATLVDIDNNTTTKTGNFSLIR